MLSIGPEPESQLAPDQAPARRPRETARAGPPKAPLMMLPRVVPTWTVEKKSSGRSSQLAKPIYYLATGIVTLLTLGGLWWGLSGGNVTPRPGETDPETVANTVPTAPDAPAVTQFGQLRMMVAPATADFTVQIDNQTYSKSELQSGVELPLGTYTVNVSAPGFEPWRETIQLASTTIPFESQIQLRPKASGTNGPQSLDDLVQ